MTDSTTLGILTNASMNPSASDFMNTSVDPYVSANTPEGDPYIKESVDPYSSMDVLEGDPYIYASVDPYVSGNDPYMNASVDPFLDVALNLATSANFSEHDSQNTTSTYFYHGTTAVITLSTLLVISMILSLGGNIMVILTIARHQGMRTRTNMLLANLAVADILVAILDMPIALVTILAGDWIFSEAFCYFNGFTVGLGLMLSCQTLMWISIHKFISITRPFSRTVTPSKIILMLVVSWTWTIGFNLTATPLIGWTDTGFKAGASQCGPPVPCKKWQYIHSALNTMFNMVIPFIVMFYCYYRIFKEVRDHLNRMQDFADTNARNSIIQQKRITVTLCIVLLLFLLFWMPYIVYSLTLVFRGQEYVWEIFNPISYLFGYMSSACNPIIYALRSPSFRRGFKEIICRDHRGRPVSDRSQFGRESSTYVGGIMVSFRRSLWRRRDTKRTTIRSRRTQGSSNQPASPLNTPVNGTNPNEFIYRFSVPPVAQADELQPTSELQGNSALENVNTDQLKNEILRDISSSNDDLSDRESSQVGEALSSDPVSDLSCKFALCNSSPNILETLETYNDNVDAQEKMPNVVPLIMTDSTNNIEDGCRCRQVSGASLWSNNADGKPRSSFQSHITSLPRPNKSQTTSSSQTHNTALNWPNLHLLRVFSKSHREILHSSGRMLESQKFASAGDITTLTRMENNDVKPQKRHKSDVRQPKWTLEWQASIDNLYSSPVLSRRRQRGHYNFKAKHERSREHLRVRAGDRGKADSDQGNKHLRVTALINNMKRSFSDLFHGDDSERNQPCATNSHPPDDEQSTETKYPSQI